MSRESRSEIWRGALHAAARGKHLWLVQFFGAAALLASAYGWLWIPESNARELLGSALLALLLAALALWLFAASLAYFDSAYGAEPLPLLFAFRRRLRNMPALLVWVAGWGVIFWLASFSDERISSWAGTLASWLTLHLRKPVSPEAVGAFLYRAHWWLAWWLIPLLVLPFGLAVSSEGFAGFRWTAIRRSSRVLGCLSYWLGVGTGVSQPLDAIHKPGPALPARLHSGLNGVAGDAFVAVARGARERTCPWDVTLRQIRKPASHRAPSSRVRSSAGSPRSTHPRTVACPYSAISDCACAFASA